MTAWRLLVLMRTRFRQPRGVLRTENNERNRGGRGHRV